MCKFILIYESSSDPIGKAKCKNSATGGQNLENFSESNVIIYLFIFLFFTFRACLAHGCLVGGDKIMEESPIPRLDGGYFMSHQLFQREENKANTSLQG